MRRAERYGVERAIACCRKFAVGAGEIIGGDDVAFTAIENRLKARCFRRDANAMPEFNAA